MLHVFGRFNSLISTGGKKAMQNEVVVRYEKMIDRDKQKQEIHLELRTER